MKRLIYFLIFATAIVVAGCSESSTNTPTNPKSAVAIKGHTYQTTNGANYIKFYFSTSMTVSMTANVNGEHISNSAMTYTIDGNTVEIYRDHSSYWQQAYQGQLLYHMIYYPADDVLKMDGNIFKRVN